MHRLRSAMPYVQFFATTHDPLCLRGLHDGEVQVLRRDSNSRIELVTGLPSVNGLTVEQLLTSDFFGLFSTEDPRLEEELLRYVTLAAKRDRSPSEEADLEEHRNATARRLRLGSTPASELVQDAVSEYLLRRREIPERRKETWRREAIEKVIALWTSLDTGDASP